jgi:adenylate cyclase
MGFEIERRFLVRGTDWRQLAARHADIRQAYLSISNKSSVRVRVCDNKIATLTVKSRPANIRRLELEYAIPILEAEALMALRQGSLIEKRRYQVPCGGDLLWEVDVFSGENLGLVIAEVELRHERQHIELPTWIAKDITGHPQYTTASWRNCPSPLGRKKCHQRSERRWPPARQPPLT